MTNTDWTPSPTVPGMETRTVNGKMETRGTPGTSAKPEVKKDPPFLPEGFDAFEYRGADGKVTAKFERLHSPQQPVDGAKPGYKQLAAEPPEHLQQGDAAPCIPEGATHVYKDDDESWFYDLIDTGNARVCCPPRRIPWRRVYTPRESLEKALAEGKFQPINTPTVEDCSRAFSAAPLGKSLEICNQFARDGGYFSDIPTHRRAEFIAAMQALAQPTVEDLQHAWDVAIKVSLPKANHAIKKFMALSGGSITECTPVNLRAAAIAALNAVK